MADRALYNKLMKEGRDGTGSITMTRHEQLLNEIPESTEHDWVRDEDGKIDNFAGVCAGTHNGPKCKKCGLEYCHHCDDPTFSCDN